MTFTVHWLWEGAKWYLNSNTDGHWILNCGPQINSISITWESVRDASPQVPSQSHWIRSSRAGAQWSVFWQALWWFWCSVKCENHCDRSRKEIFILPIHIYKALKIKKLKNILIVLLKDFYNYVDQIFFYIKAN